MHYFFWEFVKDKGHWFNVGFLYKTINNEYHRLHIRKQYYNLSLSLTATKLMLTKQLLCVDFTRPHGTLTGLSRGKVSVRKRQSRITLIGANCTCIIDWPVVGVVVPGRRHHVVVVLVVVTVGAPVCPVQTASVAWVEPPVEIWIVCWVFAWRIYHLVKMFRWIIKIDTCLNRFWKQVHESDSREPNELIVGSKQFYVHFLKL